MIMSRGSSSENDVTQENRRLKRQIADMVRIAHKHIFPDETENQVKDFFGVKTTATNQYTVEQMNK
jgi:hypothetical protein